MPVSPWPLAFPAFVLPANYVHWEETPVSHRFSAALPGVRKEEMRVEIEDSCYLIIRTERNQDASVDLLRNFERKFRLPDRINLDGITAAYADGVLTITVPRAGVGQTPRIDAVDLSDIREFLLARAA